MASIFRVREIKRIREFYRLTGYKGGVEPGDIFIGASVGGDLVGVVRIANEHGIQVLRGMRVKPEFQRQRIGARILGEVRLLLAGQECFAIAYAHLENFCGQIGFCKIDERGAPAFLQERIGRLCLKVDDISTTISALRARGVRTGDAEPKDNDFLAAFRDPDGNEICLWQYAAAGGEEDGVQASEGRFATSDKKTKL